MTDTETYSTNNLYLAAFLYASGLHLSFFKQSGKSVFFHFVPKREADRQISEYFGGTASVNPRELFARLNDLKDIIFSETRGGSHV